MGRPFEVDGVVAEALARIAACVATRGTVDWMAGVAACVAESGAGSVCPVGRGCWAMPGSGFGVVAGEVVVAVALAEAIAGDCGGAAVS